MTINEMINTLTKLREKIGGNEQVPIMATFGENDYLIPKYAVQCDLEDQDGNEFKCALIAGSGGEELTKVGTPHYKWYPSRDEFKID